MKAAGNYLFHEEQSFRQSWIMLLILSGMLAVISIQVYGLYQQLYRHVQWGTEPVSDRELLISVIVSIVVCLAVIVLFLNLTLITEVRTEGIYYRFPVLINKLKEIRKDEISGFEVGRYHPIREFGGYGIRFRMGRKRAFNVKGNQGLKLYLKNGKVVLFGTQKPYELRKAVELMMNQSNL